MVLDPEPVVSLRICPHCGQPFSAICTRCPHCGAKVYFSGPVFLGCVLLVAVFMLFALWSAGG